VEFWVGLRRCARAIHFSNGIRNSLWHLIKNLMKMERQVLLPNISVVWRLEKSVDQYFRFVVYECQIVDQLDPWPMRFPIRALPGADYYIRRGFSLLACFLHGRSEIGCVPFPDFIVLSIHVLSVQTATDATNLCRVG